MRHFILLTFHWFLLSKVYSNKLSTKVPPEKPTDKSWPRDRALTWKLECDDSPKDLITIHQNIRRAFDVWSNSTEFSFDQVKDHEKADFYFTCSSSVHSDSMQLNHLAEKFSHSSLAERSYPENIEIDSLDDWTYIYENIGYHLRSVVKKLEDDYSNTHLLDLTSLSAEQDESAMGITHVGDRSLTDTESVSRSVRSIKDKRKRKKKNKTRKNGKRKNGKRKNGKRKSGKKSDKKNGDKKKADNKKSDKKRGGKTIPTVRPLRFVTFPPEDLEKISDSFMHLKSENQLEEFSKISDMIKNVTGLFTKENIPILQRLAVSYAQTTWAVQVSFADSCAVLLKFVVKAYNIMKTSMDENDEAALKLYEKELKTDVLNQFNSFQNESRDELLKIHSDLLIKAYGGQMRNLLKQRSDYEKVVLEKEKELHVKSSEIGALDGKIEALRYQKEFSTKAMDDSEKAKREVDAEIKRLEGQTANYDQKLMEHRDTKTEERGRFWIFSWKIRDVHHDNGERIVRENLNRHLDRIRTLKDTVRGWSNENSMKHVAAIKDNLARLERETALRKDTLKKFNESYNAAVNQFYKTINEIKLVQESAGTVNLASMEAVDDLARAVQSGQHAFVSSYAALRESIKTLEVDRHLMVNSIHAALQFLNMADKYMNGTRIHDLKIKLGIKQTQANSKLITTI